MAIPAAARETLCALRREIARIEGRLPEDLAAPSLADATVLRRCGAAFRDGGLFATEVEDLDAALGGGLPKAALTEIHGIETRDAGVSSGFALALAALALKEQPGARPLLWVGTAEIFREAGFPYIAGLAQAFGLGPENFLFAEAPRLLDALWIADAAAGLGALSGIILEVRGNPEKLDLTATRRLHRRAMMAGRPVLLVRQGAEAEPTAAPVRLVVSPAPAAERETIAGPLPRSIGDPAFSVSIGKSRTARPGQFVLEWNRHDLAFQERKPAHPRRLVPLSLHGTDLAAAAGTVVAFEPPLGNAVAHRQSPREQHAEDRSARRAG